MSSASSSCSRSLDGTRIKNVGNHLIGIRAQSRRGTGLAAEAGTPGQTREPILPEVAGGEVRALRQIAGARERGGGNAGLQQRFGGRGGGLGGGPGRQGLIRRAGNDTAQRLPFLVGPRDDGDPVVVARAAPGSVQPIPR